VSQPESGVVSAIIDLLIWQYKALIIRINSGAIQPETGGDSRYVAFNRWQCLGEPERGAGVSDVLALLPPPPGSVVAFPDAVGKWPQGVMLWGLPLYCEVKSPDRRRFGKPAKPSPDQARFLAAVVERGGVGVVVDCLDDLIRVLTEKGY
jgi:hypothetical protein